MPVAIVAGSTHARLASAIAAELGSETVTRLVERFPDGELRVELRAQLAGRPCAVVQPLAAPAGEALLELALLADACRRAGAGPLNAVLPYLGYARQDRREGPGGALGARVVAELVAAAGFARVIALDLHSAALEGFFAPPLDALSAWEPLAAAAARALPPRTVVVAPDLGAVKLAERFASKLDLPIAVVTKSRLSGGEVRAVAVMGEVAGRAPLVVDDMITTGGTVEAALGAVLARGALPNAVVAAAHGVFVDGALARLGRLPIDRLVVTDSLPQPQSYPLPTTVVPVAPLLAAALRRAEPEGEGLWP